MLDGQRNILLVDLLHSNTETLIDHAMHILGVDLAQMRPEEIIKLLQHTYYHNKTTSAQSIIKNLSKETLFSVSYWMICIDKSSHHLTKQFFNATPHKNSLIIDFFSLSKIENEFNTKDPFMVLLEAEVVDQDMLPQLEERLNLLGSNETLTNRLNSARELLG